MVRVVLDGVTKTFGDVTAVDAVSLTVESGELFFLLGPSGCGKTTLLRMIAGFYDTDGGAIRFGDRDMTRVPPHKRNTGMVFQNYALWPHMSVADNVAYGLEVRDVSASDRRDRVAKALDAVRMESLADRRPNQLSGGQQQRVALARALVIEPDAVLLDWNMPVMNGIDFLRELRKTDGGDAPIVVFCTTENDAEHIQMAISTGADEYIMKPFDSEIVQLKFSQVGLI